MPYCRKILTIYMLTYSNYCMLFRYITYVWYWWNADATRSICIINWSRLLCQQTRFIYAYTLSFMQEIHIKQSCIRGYKYILYAFRDSPLCFLPKMGEKCERRNIRMRVTAQIQYLRYTNMFILYDARPLCGIYYTFSYQ